MGAAAGALDNGAETRVAEVGVGVLPGDPTGGGDGEEAMVFCLKNGEKWWSRDEGMAVLSRCNGSRRPRDDGIHNNHIPSLLGPAINSPGDASHRGRRCMTATIICGYSLVA